tara:strand:- start:56 stop:355 length:300 start_codon:yes stop_codon:yes gene_type:complete
LPKKNLVLIITLERLLFMKKSFTFLLGTFVASSLLFTIQEGKAKELKKCFVKTASGDSYDLVLKRNNKGQYVVKRKGQKITRLVTGSYDRALSRWKRDC